MKKHVSLILILTLAMLCTVPCAPAEEGHIAPLYATVGEAMEDCLVAGGIHGEYYAVVTERDGKYYRSVADYDENLTALEDAVNNIDTEAEDWSEQLDAAMQAVDDYLVTLPIAYSEEFTAQPLTEEELASMAGKTLSHLEEEGFEIQGSGTGNSEDGSEEIVYYTLRLGVFDYECAVDADLDRYQAAQENGTEGDLTVADAALAGITSWSFEKRFHTDGTVDEPEDPFAALSALMEDIYAMLEKAQSGEEIDPEVFADTLKEKYPDYADMIDFYITVYREYGIEGFTSMMGSGE